MTSAPDEPILPLKFDCLTIDDEFAYNGYNSDGYIGPTTREEDIYHKEEAVSDQEVDHKVVRERYNFDCPVNVRNTFSTVPDVQTKL